MRRDDAALAGVVWDVDDTLLLERDYVRSGFRAVARAVAPEGRAANAAFGLLWSDFDAGVRGNAFDRLLAAYPRPGVSVSDLVRVYREHTPDIALVPGAEAVLDELTALGLRQGAISDGPLASQRAKSAAVGLSRWCDPVILTDVWGRDFWKPHERAFVALEDAWGLSGRQLVYVGDNPVKDFIAPRAHGWRTIRLRLAGQLYAGRDGTDAELTVEGINALRAELVRAAGR